MPKHKMRTVIATGFLMVPVGRIFMKLLYRVRCQFRYESRIITAFTVGIFGGIVQPNMKKDTHTIGSNGQIGKLKKVPLRKLAQ